MKGIVMHRQLGIQAGRPVDFWPQPAQVARPGTLTAPRPSADLPLATPQDQQAVSAVLKERPDLSLALQRLAGIDPEQRQQEYEAIRRELLRLSQDGTLQLDLNSDKDGGAALYGGPPQGEPESSEPEVPPQVSPLSPQAVILQAYQQVSRPDVPTSLLTSRTV
jgi:hypothetical protein